MPKPRTAAHAILQALSAKLMEPRELCRHARLFASPMAVYSAIKRLRRAGLIEVRFRLTDKGRAELDRLTADRTEPT